MFSDKTLQEMIYPFFRAIIFVFSSLVLFVFIAPFLGMRESYHDLLVQDGVIVFILFRFVVLLPITLFSFGLLYLLGNWCKRKTTKKTYLVLFLLLLGIAVFVTISFIDANLWSYTDEGN